MQELDKLATDHEYMVSAVLENYGRIHRFENWEHVAIVDGMAVAYDAKFIVDLLKVFRDKPVSVQYIKHPNPESQKSDRTVYMSLYIRERTANTGKLFEEGQEAIVYLLPSTAKDLHGWKAWFVPTDEIPHAGTHLMICTIPKDQKVPLMDIYDMHGKFNWIFLDLILEDTPIKHQLKALSAMHPPLPPNLFKKKFSKSDEEGSGELLISHGVNNMNIADQDLEDDDNSPGDSKTDK